MVLLLNFTFSLDACWVNLLRIYRVQSHKSSYIQQKEMQEIDVLLDRCFAGRKIMLSTGHILSLIVFEVLASVRMHFPHISKVETLTCTTVCLTIYCHLETFLGCVNQAEEEAEFMM